jgi:hypothetical protein
VHLIKELSHIVFSRSSLFHQPMGISHQIAINIIAVGEASDLKAGFSKFLHEHLTSYFEDILGWAFELDGGVEFPDDFLEKLIALAVA